MTAKQIEAAKSRDAVKFDTAKAIREILDAAKKTIGAEAWEANDMESTIISLVVDDE